jgi:hypothetical protein
LLGIRNIMGRKRINLLGTKWGDWVVIGESPNLHPQLVDCPHLKLLPSTFDCPHGLGPLHLLVDLFCLLALSPLLYVKSIWKWIKSKMDDTSADNPPKGS